jgi:hypothetical protein
VSSRLFRHERGREREGEGERERERGGERARENYQVVGRHYTFRRSMILLLIKYYYRNRTNWDGFCNALLLIRDDITEY